MIASNRISRIADIELERGLTTQTERPARRRQVRSPCVTQSAGVHPSEAGRPTNFKIQLDWSIRSSAWLGGIGHGEKALMPMAKRRSASSELAAMATGTAKQ